MCAAQTDAVLLDLGGVVVDIDFQRVFDYWARCAEVDVARFHQHWGMDDAYCAHEVGALNFKGYTEHLGQLFDVSLTNSQWRDGWNEIFVGPYQAVLQRVHALQERLPVYAFSNTNHTHEAYWRRNTPEVIQAFVEVFISSRIRRRKPDVDAFRYVAARMGTEPERILFLDDNTENIEGAKRAGLQVKQVLGSDAVLAALEHL